MIETIFFITVGILESESFVYIQYEYMHTVIIINAILKKR